MVSHQTITTCCHWNSTNWRCCGVKRRRRKRRRRSPYPVWTTWSRSWVSKPDLRTTWRNQRNANSNLQHWPPYNNVTFAIRRWVLLTSAVFFALYASLFFLLFTLLYSSLYCFVHWCIDPKRRSGIFRFDFKYLINRQVEGVRTSFSRRPTGQF